MISFNDKTGNFKYRTSVGSIARDPGEYLYDGNVPSMSMEKFFGTLLFKNDRYTHFLESGDIRACNEFRENNPEFTPCLQGMDLRGKNLKGVDFENACLAGADLRGARLAGADLRCADLRGAKLPHMEAINKIRIPVIEGFDSKIHSMIPSLCSAEERRWDTKRRSWEETTLNAIEGGWDLAAKLEVSTAAALIYAVNSCARGFVPNFWTNREDMLAIIKLLMELEKFKSRSV